MNNTLTPKNNVARKMTPIADRLLGAGTANKIRGFGTKVLSKATGISPENLTKNKPSIAENIGAKFLR